jgi:hypothetical protein
VRQLLESRLIAAQSRTNVTSVFGDPIIPIADSTAVPISMEF